MARHSDNGYLFPHMVTPRRHVPEDCVSSSIHKLCISNFVQAAHAHAFRKGFITHVIKSGCTVQEAAQLVGHRSVQLTEQVYNCNEPDITDTLRRVPPLLPPTEHSANERIRRPVCPDDARATTSGMNDIVLSADAPYQDRIVANMHQDTNIPAKMTAEQYACMLLTIRSLQERCDLAESFLHTNEKVDTDYRAALTSLPDRIGLLYKQSTDPISSVRTIQLMENKM